MSIFIKKKNYRCGFSHIWETNLEKLRKNEWCDKCMEKLIKCRLFAEKMNWKLLNETFLSDLTFQCPLGHEITATAKKSSFLKKFQKKIDYFFWIFSYEHKTSCLLCKKIARQQHLEHLKEEEEKMFQERLKTQVFKNFLLF